MGSLGISGRSTPPTSAKRCLMAVARSGSVGDGRVGATTVVRMAVISASTVRPF